MELAVITMQQVAVLFILMFIGFVSVKAGFIKIEWKQAFSNLLLYVVNPCLVINSYLAEYDPEIMKDLIKTFALAAIFMVVGFVISHICCCFIKGENKSITKFACSFSNAAYMGFPLIQALFGSEGLIFASAFFTVFNIFIWTYGYSVVSSDKGVGKIIKSIVTQPSIIAVVIGLIIYIGRVPVPVLIAQPMSNVAAINTPLSMIITGMIIATTSFSSLVKTTRLYFVFFVRMLLVPLVCFLIMYIFGLDSRYASIAFLLEACPTAAITPVFAVLFGHDEKIAAGAVVTTTLLSIIFLPMWAYIITTFI